MKTKKNREINVFSVSFLDVLANTIGGLAFLLILAVMMVGALVFSPPRITTEKLPDGYDGRPYLAWLGAREGLGQFRWSFGEGERPQGLELDPSSGKLSGKLDLAPQAGDEKRFEFTVVCEAQTDDTQGKSKTDTRRFSLVLHRNVPIDTRPLRISTEAVLPDAYRHQPYPFAFAAEGGQAPYTWSATGQLPPGLKLTEDGKLQGKPSEAQTYTFRVTVATPQAESQTGTFTLSVSEKYPPHPPTPPLEIKTRSVPDARAEQSYSLALAAEGGIPPYKWTRSDGSPGAGMTLTSNGSLQGSPERPGAFAFSVTVSDVKGQTARAQLSLRVLPPLKPVTVRTKQAASGQVGRPYDLALAAVGGCWS